MNKFFNRIKALVNKRTFWINALGGAAIVINQITPLLPAAYIAEATIALNIINRFIKLINEEKIETK